jgi:subtilisin
MILQNKSNLFLLNRSIGNSLQRENTKYKAALALANNPNIEYVEEDAKVHIVSQVTPWGITKIKAIDVQQSGFTGMGVKIGIIDSGIDFTYEDLDVTEGVTFVEGTTNFLDDNGHGTHFAGTVAALSNELGVIGAASRVDLYAIKVINQYGDGNYSDLVSGIEWAITNNMDIINMSLGGHSESRTLKKAVDNAFNAGVLLIASAGNSGYNKKGSITYPANMIRLSLLALLINGTKGPHSQAWDVNLI